MSATSHKSSISLVTTVVSTLAATGKLPAAKGSISLVGSSIIKMNGLATIAVQLPTAGSDHEPRDANSAVQSAPFAWQLLQPVFESVLQPFLINQVKGEYDRQPCSANLSWPAGFLQYNSIHGIMINGPPVRTLLAKHVPIALNLSRHWE